LISQLDRIVTRDNLLTQGKIFEDEILAGPECTNNPAEEVAEPYDHAQNLTGTLPIELAAKSLILRVYDVLMNDRLRQPEWSPYLRSQAASARRQTMTMLRGHRPEGTVIDDA
jgi:hypothetical protein